MQRASFEAPTLASHQMLANNNNNNNNNK